MSILETILGVLSGQSGTNNASPIVQILGELLQGGAQGGQNGQGLLALIQQFQNSGLGDKVESWISTGANLPINSQDIGNVLSGGQLGQWAEKFGISSEDVSNQLAQHLPNLIDKLSPNGQMPQNFDGIASMAQTFLSQMNKQA
jgi:uncharacterized protein YidB (DUF937 family)